MSITTTRTAQFHGAQDIRFDDVPVRKLATHEVRIGNAYNGVCGTDLHLYFDPDHSVVPIQHDDAGNVVPIPLGHEYSGTVLEIGSDVTKVAVGDRVAVFPVAYCGSCAVCVSGAPAFMCTNQGTGPAGIGDQDIRHERHLHKLPESVDLLQGALVEPMAVSYHAVKKVDPQPDDTAIVAGAGPIGVGAFLALRAAGVTRILVTEPSAERREIIEGLGAQTIDPISEDLVAAVRQLSDGRGANYFFDAAGAGPVFSQGMEALAAYGKYVVIAVHAKPVAVDLWGLQVSEKEVIGSIIYTPADFDEVIALMADGAYPTHGWVTVRPSSDIETVMAELQNGQGTKILLHN